MPSTSFLKNIKKYFHGLGRLCRSLKRASTYPYARKCSDEFVDAVCTGKVKFDNEQGRSQDFRKGGGGGGTLKITINSPQKSQEKRFITISATRFRAP